MSRDPLSKVCSWSMSKIVDRVMQIWEYAFWLIFNFLLLIITKLNSFQHKCLRTLLKTRFSTLHYICYTYFQQFRVTDEEVVAYSWPTHTADGSDWVGPFVTCFDDALGLSPQPEPNHLSNSTQIRPKSLDCWTISSFYILFIIISYS